VGLVLLHCLRLWYQVSALHPSLQSILKVLIRFNLATTVHTRCTKITIGTHSHSVFTEHVCVWHVLARCAVMRVSQLDAHHLDRELTAMLGYQFRRVFKYLDTGTHLHPSSMHCNHVLCRIDSTAQFNS